MEINVGQIYLMELMPDQLYACRVHSKTEHQIELNFSQTEKNLQEFAPADLATVKFLEVSDKLQLPDYISDVSASGWKFFKELECANTVIQDTFDLSGCTILSLKNAPKYVKKLDISNGRLRSLDCTNTVVSEFIVRGNSLLRSLNNGPREAESINARSCGLFSLKTNTKGLKSLDVSFNPIESVKDCPIVEKLIIEDSPQIMELLYLSGRCKTLSFEKKSFKNEVEVKSVFRFKLSLIQRGRKDNATL